MEIRVCGYGQERLVVKVQGYAYPDADCYWDGNWLACSVEAVVSGFTAVYPTAIRTDEFRAFLDGVERLQEAGTGKVRLENMDDTIELSLQYDPSGRRVWSGRLSSPTGKGTGLSFAFRADPSTIPELARALRDVIGGYPVRGIAAVEAAEGV